MEPRAFEHGDVHLRVDQGIFEPFRRIRLIGSYRTPLSWVTARAEARKGGVTRPHFENVDAPVHAATTSSRHLLATVGISTADEHLYRAFLTEPAPLSDRRVGP